MTEIEIRKLIQKEVSSAIARERQRLQARAEDLGNDILIDGAGTLLNLVKLFEDDR